jgi:hypothetical protein
MDGSNCLVVYLSSELTLIDTRVLWARCPLAGVPGSACETSPPRYYHATSTLPSWRVHCCLQPKRGILTKFLLRVRLRPFTNP